MSAEHKRPLVAFIAVAVLCALFLGHAIRSEAIVGVLRALPGPVAGLSVELPGHGSARAGEDELRALGEPPVARTPEPTRVERAPSPRVGQASRSSILPSSSRNGGEPQSRPAPRAVTPPRQVPAPVPPVKVGPPEVTPPVTPPAAPPETPPVTTPAAPPAVPPTSTPVVPVTTPAVPPSTPAPRPPAARIPVVPTPAIQTPAVRPPATRPPAVPSVPAARPPVVPAVPVVKPPAVRPPVVPVVPAARAVEVLRETLRAALAQLASRVQGHGPTLPTPGRSTPGAPAATPSATPTVPAPTPAATPSNPALPVVPTEPASGTPTAVPSSPSGLRQSPFGDLQPSRG